MAGMTTRSTLDASRAIVALPPAFALVPSEGGPGWPGPTSAPLATDADHDTAGLTARTQSEASAPRTHAAPSRRAVRLASHPLHLPPGDSHG